MKQALQMLGPPELGGAEVFRAAFDAVGVGLCVVGVDGRLMAANDSWLRSAGLDRAAALGRGLWELFPGTPPELRRLHDEVRAGRTVEVPPHLQRIGDREAWFQGQLAPLPLPGGVGVLVTSFEITEQRRAQEGLRESEQRFAAIFEHASVALALTRMPEREIVQVNQAFLALFECSREEVLGRSSADLGLAEPADLDHIADELEHQGHITGMQVTRRTRSGRRLRLMLSVEPVSLAGRPYLLTTGLDVTDLVAAREALAEADRRKTEFLAVLSHELRNPLAPIHNSIYLLENAPPGSPTAQRAREVLERQAHQLSRLVDDLLDISRVTHGKIEVRLERLDAREVVRRACADARALFEDRDVELALSLDEEPLWVDADAARLAQMLGNLLHNALKFTPPRGRVALRAQRGEGTAVVTVRDSGLGIEAAELERIFDPFFQAARAQRAGRGHGGLGLGLALVRALAAKHGGTVRAESPGLGGGASFVLELPLAAAPAQSAAPAVGARAEGLAVLVVEDNEDAATTLADLLSLTGHRVRTAPTGRAGLDAIAAERPDVLVCDVGLPDMSGHDVIRAVRSGERGPPLFALALTGYAQPQDREEALAAGFDAHLPKPPPFEELQALLARAAARRAPGTAG